jgi:hypothetical protein
MTGPQIPIGHIDWVKVVLYDLQDFCPTYITIESISYHTTFPTQHSSYTDPKITICLHVLRIKPVNIVPASGSNATTAHGANHIGTGRLADAVNYPRGESPNRSVGRTVRTISPSIHAMSQDSNLLPRSRNTKRLFRS